MHHKFAQRIAAIVFAKKKAAGAEATAAWWRQAFPRMAPEDVAQVTNCFTQMR